MTKIMEILKSHMMIKIEAKREFNDFLIEGVEKFIGQIIGNLSSTEKR